MKKKWELMEKKDTKLFHTTAQRGSGNQDHFPTDSFSDDFAVETKQTDKASYSISCATWDKLREETALLWQKDGKNRIPLISLHLQSRHVVVLSYEDFRKIHEDAWKYQDLQD